MSNSKKIYDPHSIASKVGRRLVPTAEYIHQLAGCVDVISIHAEAPHICLSVEVRTPEGYYMYLSHDVIHLPEEWVDEHNRGWYGIMATSANVAYDARLVKKDGCWYRAKDIGGAQ